MDEDLKPPEMPDEINVFRTGKDHGHWFVADIAKDQVKYTRATDCREADVEILKRDVQEALRKTTYVFSQGGADFAIDYLAVRNLIRGAVEPIDGLDEAIQDMDEFSRSFNIDDRLFTHYGFDKIMKAAARYQTMTKGE